MLADRRLKRCTGLFGLRQRQVEARLDGMQAVAGQHPAALKQHHMVGEPRHFVEGMADVEQRHLEHVVQALEVGQDFLPARRVERRQGFVHQQQTRAGEQGTADGHALPFAAGKRADLAPFEQAFEAQPADDGVEVEFGADSTLAGWNAFLPEFEIGAHREVRQEARLLENVTQRAVMRRNEDTFLAFVLPDLAIDAHPSAGATFEPGQGAQERRLARTRRSEQRTHPVSGQGQVDVERELATRKLKPGDDA